MSERNSVEIVKSAWVLQDLKDLKHDGRTTQVKCVLRSNSTPGVTKETWVPVGKLSDKKPHIYHRPLQGLSRSHSAPPSTGVENIEPIDLTQDSSPRNIPRMKGTPPPRLLKRRKVAPKRRNPTPEPETPPLRKRKPSAPPKPPTKRRRLNSSVPKVVILSDAESESDDETIISVQSDSSRQSISTPRISRPAVAENRKPYVYKTPEKPPRSKRLRRADTWPPQPQSRRCSIPQSVSFTNEFTPEQMLQKFTDLLQNLQRKKKIQGLWDERNIERLRRIITYYRQHALDNGEWGNVGSALDVQTEVYCRRVDTLFRHTEKVRDTLYSTSKRQSDEQVSVDELGVNAKKRRLRVNKKTIYVGTPLQRNPHKPVIENLRLDPSKSIPYEQSVGGTLNYMIYKAEAKYLKTRSLHADNGEDESEIEVGGKRKRLEDVLAEEMSQRKKRPKLSQKKQQLARELIPNKILDLVKASIDGVDLTQVQSQARIVSPMPYALSPIPLGTPVNMSPVLDFDNEGPGMALSPTFSDVTEVMEESQSQLLSSPVLFPPVQEKDSDKEEDIPFNSKNSEELLPPPKAGMEPDPADQDIVPEVSDEENDDDEDDSYGMSIDRLLEKAKPKAKTPPPEEPKEAAKSEEAEQVEVDLTKSTPVEKVDEKAENSAEIEAEPIIDEKESAEPAEEEPSSSESESEDEDVADKNSDLLFAAQRLINTERFQKMVTQQARFDEEMGEAIATFQQVTFRTPRGKFKLDFYADQLRLKSDLLKNSIKYEAIKKCFLFQQPHGKTAIIISVDPPIRQGQTTYNFLLCEFDQDEEATTTINATDEELKNEYADRSGNQILEQVVKAKMTDILISLFSCLAKAKTISHSHKTFKSTEGYPCLRCALKANQGYIYPLGKSFFFIHKPPTFIRYSEIQYIQFDKIAQSSSIRSFDLLIKTQNAEYKFMNIALNEFEPLFNFCDKKGDKLRIANKTKLRQWLTDERESGVRKSRRIQEDLNLGTLNLKDSEEESEDESDGDFDEADEEARKMLEEDEADDDK